MPDITRTCAACDISIDHRHPLATSCSTACYQWSRSHPGTPRPTRVCPACGKSIAHLPPQAKTCNQNCRYWAKKHPGVVRPDKMVCSPETRAKIAAVHRGMKHSAETRAKLSEIASRMLRGRPVSRETREKIAAAQSGADAYQWAGEAVGYSGAHKRHRAALPKFCANCGASEAILDAALRHDIPASHLTWDEVRRLHYSADTDDYMTLCRGCHVAYDRRHRAMERARSGR